MKKIGYIRATFIGANGSMGFTNGKEYPLEIWECGTIERIINDYSFGIVRMEDKIFCPYTNIMTFLMNWSNK
jgi:hypothetical protein